MALSTLVQFSKTITTSGTLQDFPQLFSSYLMLMPVSENQLPRNGHGYSNKNFKAPRYRQFCFVVRAKSSGIVPSSEAAGSSSNRFSKAKRLVLLRHAKSSWDDPSLKDHDRPLSKRGTAASANIAQKLWQSGWIPDLILCSDAVRTRQTLDIMTEAAGAFSEAEVRFLGSFYSVAAMDGETTAHLHSMVLKYASEEVSTVMCMGHNKGWEEAATELSGRTIELKTATAALFEAKETEKSWDDVWKSGWNLVEVVGPDRL